MMSFIHSTTKIKYEQLFPFTFMEIQDSKLHLNFRAWGHLRKIPPRPFKTCSFYKSVSHRAFSLRELKENLQEQILQDCNTVKNENYEGINRNVLTLAEWGESTVLESPKLTKILLTASAIYTFSTLFINNKYWWTLYNTSFLKYKVVSSFISSVFATELIIYFKQSKSPEMLWLHCGQP